MKRRTHNEWLKILEEAPRGIIPGSPALILEQAMMLRMLLERDGMVKAGDSVLDYGCGIGRMGIALSDLPLRYHGIDVSREAIAYCRKIFKDCSHYVFNILHVRNRKYRKHCLFSPRRTKLPYPDASFDLVLAISVFTHIGDAKARDRTLSELSRVLKSGGKAWISWFAAPPNTPDYGDERTVWEKPEIVNALSDFEIMKEWGGETNDAHDQFVTYLKKK